jgi:hypothetical protein
MGEATVYKADLVVGENIQTTRRKRVDCSCWLLSRNQSLTRCSPVLGGGKEESHHVVTFRSSSVEYTRFAADGFLTIQDTFSCC